MRILSIKVDDFLKYVSVLSLIFYLGGIVYNVFYFNNFNIDILVYIDWTESLLLFIPFLFDILILSILGTPLLYFIYNYFIQRNLKKELDKGVEPHMISEVGWILFGYLITIGFFFLIRVVFSWKFTYFTTIAIPLLIFHVIQLLITDYLRRKGTVFTFIHLAPLFVILFTSYLFIKGNERVFKVRSNKPLIGVSFVLGDNTRIQTGSDTVLIGQSKNYIFLYSISNKTSTAFSKATVSKIDILENR